ncbi:MAG: hypothetical protein F2672_04800 [Actinobacteria bacterium]|uniref:Unannotated protein n=1 Tax=freshwater metagenome TaxID=449393 RepID=A0A6J6QE79_9ZZZZ|nr:hypothetical protein [Actinomycetota bacterium]
MSEISNSEKIDLAGVKRRIAEISLKPLDVHSQEFEAIHEDLNRALSEIDGL